MIKHTHLILLVLVFALFLMCCNTVENYNKLSNNGNKPNNKMRFNYILVILLFLLCGCGYQSIYKVDKGEFSIINFEINGPDKITRSLNSIFVCKLKLSSINNL